MQTAAVWGGLPGMEMSKLASISEAFSFSSSLAGIYQLGQLRSWHGFSGPCPSQGRSATSSMVDFPFKSAVRTALLAQQKGFDLLKLPSHLRPDFESFCLPSKEQLFQFFFHLCNGVLPLKIGYAISGGL